MKRPALPIHAPTTKLPSTAWLSTRIPLLALILHLAVVVESFTICGVGLGGCIHAHRQWSSIRKRSTGAFLKVTSLEGPQSADNEPALDRLADDAINNNPLQDAETGNVHIPSTGVSISDAMDEAQKDRFVTTLVPLPGKSGGVVAQLITTAINSATLEPLRYLVALSPPSNTTTSTTGSPNDETTTIPAPTTNDYCLVDLPPYSPQLVQQMRQFMGGSAGRLVAILLTSRNAIHNDEDNKSQVMTSTRRAECQAWRQAFPDAALVAYRLDIPRDCRPYVTQVLDGYGPFAWKEEEEDGEDETSANNGAVPPKNNNATFVETGRPLTYHAWDHSEAQDILNGKLKPEDAAATNTDGLSSTLSDLHYTPESIRQREEGKSILAVYTPGHTFGSVSYVFPEIQMCCSGSTLPVEDPRRSNNDAGGATGPILDCRGYITTSQAGIQRQTESARHLVQTYGDRFTTVLPSRGDPLQFAEDDRPEERQAMLLEMIEQYRRIGQIYEQLGITNDDDDDDDDNDSSV